MLKALSVLSLATLLCTCGTAPDAAQPTAPNLVLIFIDDLGYGDINPFAETPYPTPHLDALAAAGTRFTDFSACTAVCSASRAGLLTGCNHQRVGIQGALGPSSNVGIADEEVTLAELCRDAGYRTACFGKWHLGHHPRFLPTRHGFDTYYGLPYSNDMWPLHPDYAKHPPGTEARKRGYPPLPLLEDEKVIDSEVDGREQGLLTKQYTERAVAFIEESAAAEQPFFVYLPHTMVHVPLFASPEFEGKSGQGIFGDVMMEIDWSVGQVVAAVERLGLAEDTLIVFTSDNGPWLSYGDHAGGTGGLREGKGTMWEGGIRVPTVARWTGTIPAGRTCAEFASTLDVLPTMRALLGAPPADPDRPIDGHDITPLLVGAPGARSPHEAFPLYYAGGQLQGVRDARFKLMFAHRYRTLAGRPGGTGGQPVKYEQTATEQALFDLRSDPRETTDVSAQHPEVVARLEAAAARIRAELGDRLTETKPTARRGPGRLQEGDPKLVW